MLPIPKITCITVDDEPLALRQMEEFIRQTPFLEFSGGYHSGFEALQFLANQSVDLIFLDIQMPDLNGIDFFNSIETKPEVIFTTAFSQFAIEGFRVNAIDYLLKPIGYADFLKSANKAQLYFQRKAAALKPAVTTGESIFVKADYRMVRIQFNEITYVEGMREYVRIHTTSGKPVMTLMSMKSFIEKLPHNQFLRVHKSFIVNTKQITTIERGRILFGKEVIIPVGDQYKAKFQEFIDQHFIE